MTSSGGYWVDLYQARKRLGGGFLLTRRYVLTALHCLRDLTADDGSLEIVLDDGQRLDGRLHSQDSKADLCLIEVAAHHQISRWVPNAGHAMAGWRWEGPYRPSSDEARLSGTIHNRADGFMCSGGASIEALQLSVEQFLGDYSGYSGGPVQGVPPEALDDHKPLIVGILLEQALDRVDETRAGNVLYAATIAEAIARFDHLQVSHLIDVLRPQDDESSAAARVVDTTAVNGEKAEAWFHRLQQWAEQGFMDPTQVAQLRFLVAQRAISSDFEGGEG